ncbi:MAG: universal stress protein [Gammaproteobacteria bacterium]|jgi:universal stress protein E
MKRILAVADPLGGSQKVVDRAVNLANRTGADLQVVGFVYEHLASLPVSESGVPVEEIREKLLEAHRSEIAEAVNTARGKSKAPECSVEVFWEKRVAPWIIDRVAKDPVDLVIKGAHRSETFTYTSTDWQLLRGCQASVMLVAGKRWKKSDNVLAAVDLGTRSATKKSLNHKVVEEASALAAALDSGLIVSYAVPVSRVLRDLDIIDEKKVRREGRKRLDAFCESLEKRGVAVAGRQLVTGAPEKALVNAAAKNRAGLVVLGSVGRKRLAGKVIGNTAEQILRLVRADVLAVRPG